MNPTISPLSSATRVMASASSVRRMLPAFAVACRNGFDCRQTIALRIEVRVLISTLHVDEDDAVSVFFLKQRDGW